MTPWWLQGCCSGALIGFTVPALLTPSACCRRVVSEWGFEKDGLSRGMVDMVNDSKGAQLDSRDTFLGIGSKT